MRAVSLAVLLACAAPPAHAGPLNLRWNSCRGDGGAMARSFACHMNEGSETMVGSFILPEAIARVSGNEMIVDIAFATPTIPSWWILRRPGTCRVNALWF